MDFVEFETEDGEVTINVEHILYVQAGEEGKTVVRLKNDETFEVSEEYENISGFLMWVAAGRPEDDVCPDCGEPLTEHDPEETGEAN